MVDTHFAKGQLRDTSTEASRLFKGFQYLLHYADPLWKDLRVFYMTQLIQLKRRNGKMAKWQIFQPALQRFRINVLKTNRQLSHLSCVIYDDDFKKN